MFRNISFSKFKRIDVFYVKINYKSNKNKEGTALPPNIFKSPALHHSIKLQDSEFIEWILYKDQCDTTFFESCQVLLLCGPKTLLSRDVGGQDDHVKTRCEPTCGLRLADGEPDLLLLQYVCSSESYTAKNIPRYEY